jgi:MYXO-CTERM domain-containing protein
VLGVASGGPALDQRWRLLGLLGAWWVVFALGSACVLAAGKRRPGLVLVMVVAVGLRLAALVGVPVLSDDVHRYAWDARVQEAGIDPYRLPPTAPELVALRDPWLWPDAAGCADLDRPPGCTRINRPDEPTIYPPLAQVWFRAGDLLLPEAARDRGWQAVAAAVDLVLVAALALVLSRRGADPNAVVLYAWSPLAVLESAQSAHLDALAVLVALAALWASRRRRPALAGVLLGAATLVKLYPAVLLPVLVGRARPARARQGLVTAVAFAATVGLGYARHVASVGVDVVGYLPGYLAEEGYAEGNRFLLLGLVGLSGTGAQVVAAAGLVAAAAWAWRARARPEVGAARLFGAALLLATPVQPWYALLLVALATLARRWWWIAVAVAGYPVYLAALLDAPIAPIGRVSYGLAALVVVLGERSSRSRSRSPSRPGLGSGSGGSGEPAAPGQGEAGGGQTGAGGQAGDVIGSHPGPGKPRTHALAGSALDPHGERLADRARGLDLDQRLAPGGEEGADPPQQGERVPADADVAVEQDGRAPTTFPREGVEDRAAQHRGALPGRLGHGHG